VYVVVLNLHGLDKAHPRYQCSLIDRLDDIFIARCVQPRNDVFVFPKCPCRLRFFGIFTWFGNGLPRRGAAVGQNVALAN